MKRTLRTPLVLATAFAALPAIAALSVAAGSVPPGIVAGVTGRSDFADAGLVPAGMPIRVRVVLARQPDNAGARALRMSGATVTAGRYLAYFAPPPERYALVIGDLRRNGFTIAAVAANRAHVDAVAPAATIDRYFHTQVHRVFQLGAGERFANSTPAVVPAGLRGLVARVDGLTTLAPIERPNPNAGTATYGDLTNFDTFNDEDEVEHGFEIEIDGDKPADVAGTFAQNRYGVPQIVSFVRGKLTGIYVRYESPYDRIHKTFTIGTPIAKTITPTAGHYCWPGGEGANIWPAVASISASPSRASRAKCCTTGCARTPPPAGP